MAVQRTVLVSCLMLAVALAGCADNDTNQGIDDVVGGAGTGGGNVNDIAPVVGASEMSASVADNSGTSSIFISGTLSDLNSELDLEGAIASVALSGVYTGTFSRTFTNLEVAGNDAEPSEYTDGWKVWSGDALDGVMHYKFRFTVPVGTEPGTLSFTPSVDPDGAGGASPIVGTANDVAVTVFSELVVSGPYLLDGTDDSGNRWGLWNANPGQQNVGSENYIKIVNTGQDAIASVVIDFTEGNFTGVTDANWTIPAGDNVEFAWFESTDPASVPSDGTFTYLTGNADGSVTTTFTGKGNVIWVHYKVLELPSPLFAQTYGVAYTATEL